MAVHSLGPQDGLYFEHQPPSRAEGLTFVFFNALTGDAAMWNEAIVPALRKKGHGALVYNMRGQTGSPFTPGVQLDQGLIVADAVELIKEVQPGRPVLVGLSIGGLFAARALLEGVEAEALVLINTLRRDGPRLNWINDAIVRCVEVGGMALMRDLYFPLLFDEKWLAANRLEHLDDAPYAPLDKESGHYNLLGNAGKADWDIPYEKLNVPVLAISGLQDHVFYDRKVVADLVSRIPDARGVDIADAGHMVPIENPAALIVALLEFAEGL